MSARIIIDGEDGSLSVGKDGDNVTFNVKDGLFDLTIRVAPNDARSLAGFLNESTYLSFDGVEVGDDEDCS